MSEIQGLKPSCSTRFTIYFFFNGNYRWHCAQSSCEVQFVFLESDPQSKLSKKKAVSKSTGFFLEALKIIKIENILTGKHSM